MDDHPRRRRVSDRPRREGPGRRLGCRRRRGAPAGGRARVVVDRARRADPHRAGARDSPRVDADGPLSRRAPRERDAPRHGGRRRFGGSAARGGRRCSGGRPPSRSSCASYAHETAAPCLARGGDPRPTRLPSLGLCNGPAPSDRDRVRARRPPLRRARHRPGRLGAQRRARRTSVRARTDRPARIALAGPNALRLGERQGRGAARRRRTPNRRARASLRPPPAGHDRRRPRRPALPRLGVDLRCVRRGRPAQRGDPLLPARRQRPARGRDRLAQSVRARVRRTAASTPR